MPARRRRDRRAVRIGARGGGQHDPVIYLILCLIPCISIVGAWFLASDTAELFGKGTGWKLFLFLIPGVSHLILGFGDESVDPSRVAPGVGLNAQTP